METDGAPSRSFLERGAGGNGRKANPRSESTSHQLLDTPYRFIRRADTMPRGAQHKPLRRESVTPAQAASLDDPRTWPKTLHLGVGGGG
jgi:hypothetical protein